jgi:hypothetical protein
VPTIAPSAYSSTPVTCFDDEVEPLIRRGRSGEEHAVQTRALAGGDPVGCRIRRHIRCDQPGASGGEQVVGITIHAVLHHRVPVRHHQDRHIDPRRDLAHGGERVTQAEAAGQGRNGRLLDDRAVHDGVRVGRTQFEHVRATLGQEHCGVDARLQVGVADREVADERTTAFRVRGVDRRSDS